MTEGGLTYSTAGVDIERGEALVSRIKSIVGREKRPGLLSGIGGFGALVSLKEALPAFSQMDDPVLVSGTDGVGTKLKIAFASGVHNTIGIDLVAMCVNDIVTLGAEPLFFLDYFATGRLDVDVAAEVVEGIAAGCRLARASLVGGETAELPGFYPDGEYDLAGFAVGVVDRKDIIDGRNVQPGDIIIGVGSSGLHSNGYSLARKALLERGGHELSSPASYDSSTTWSEILLKPTRIYVQALDALRPAARPRAVAHITGGGLTLNLPRVLKKGLVGRIEKDKLPTLPLFEEIQATGSIEEEEMFRTFNMGIGLVCVVEAAKADLAMELLTNAGERAYRLGSIAQASSPEAAPTVVFG